MAVFFCLLLGLVVWDCHLPENKLVNNSHCSVVVDENQIIRVLLGCCAWPRHAYRHVLTLTRRCGFLAVLPLGATGGKGVRANGVDSAPCRSWSVRVSVPKEGAKHSGR